VAGGRGKANEQLLGRTGEREQLASMLARIRAGGASAIVEGEPGIGKTRLVQAALAGAGDLTVLGAAADELEAHRPFGLLLRCLAISARSPDPRRAAVAALLAEAPFRPAALTPGDGAQLEFRVCEAILALVDELCADGPVVLALEDLHWADESSLLVLRMLARDLPLFPLGLLCTMRPLPRSPALGALLEALRSQGAVTVRLGPLPDDAVAALVTKQLHGRPGAVLLRQLVTAGGNPLFLTELVAALLESGAVAVGDDGVAEIDAPVETPDLLVTILSRLRFLAPATLDALQLAAVMGASFSVAELCAAFGRPAAEVARPLHDAIRAGVLHETPDGLRFRHELVRRALYEDMPESIRVGLHRDAARALIAAGGRADRAVDHLLIGACDDESLRQLRGAAASLAPRAPGVAATLLERALELDPTGMLRAEAIAELVVSLMWAGRLVDAERLCRAALEDGIADEDAGRLHQCVVQMLLVRGQVREALAHARSAEDSLSAEENVRLRAYGAFARLFGGDHEGAVREAGELLTDVQLDDIACSHAFATIAHAAIFGARYGEARALAKRAIATATAAGTCDAHRAQPHVLGALVLTELDRLDEAIEMLARGREIAEALGMRGMLSIYHNLTAYAHFWSGRWDDAVAELETAVRLARQTDTGWGMTVYRLRALIALHRGERAEAESWITLAEDELALGMPEYRPTFTWWVRALLSAADGDPGAALSKLTDAWDLSIRGGFAFDRPRIGPDLIKLARERGDDGLAGAVVADVEAIANGAPDAPWLQAAALRCRGLHDDDAEQLLRAVAACRASRRPLELAEALEDAAVAVAAQGRAPDAVTLVNEAIELLDAMGASRDCARLARRLRELGVRPGRRGERRRPARGWQALTETELRVTWLVAEGLSNPQIAERLFVSRRTVQTHVSHVLRKLGLSSRSEVAAVAARRAASAPA
jgi:DNA-binding CsgD family transcriptional regulator